MTKVAAIEYPKQNIRVNVVGPGFIDTPLLPSLDPTRPEAIVAASHLSDVAVRRERDA